MEKSLEMVKKDPDKRESDSSFYELAQNANDGIVVALKDGSFVFRIQFFRGRTPH